MNTKTKATTPYTGQICWIMLTGAWITDLLTGRPALAKARPAPTQLRQEDAPTSTTWLHYLASLPGFPILVFIRRNELSDYTDLLFPT